MPNMRPRKKEALHSMADSSDGQYVPSPVGARTLSRSRLAQLRAEQENLLGNKDALEYLTESESQASTRTSRSKLAQLKAEQESFLENKKYLTEPEQSVSSTRTSSRAVSPNHDVDPIFQWQERRRSTRTKATQRATLTPSSVVPSAAQSDGSEVESHDSETCKRRRRRNQKRPVKRVKIEQPIDETEVEDFEEWPLPPSDTDLLFSGTDLARAFGIFEFMRAFSVLVQVAWFSFEDFCAAIDAKQSNALVSEVHAAILQELLQDDDAARVLYAPGDDGSDDVMSLALSVLDRYTWPAVLYRFLVSNSDCHATLGKAIHALSCTEYWQLPREYKLLILDYLVSQYPGTQRMRTFLDNGGEFLGAETCTACNQEGELICCESCPRVLHLHCIEPKLSKVPEGDWHCPTCCGLMLKGVNDCVLSLYRGALVRAPPLGVDDHFRVYRFVARRLIVEDSLGNIIAYYSNVEHLNELLDSLRGRVRDETDTNEAELLETLEDVQEEVAIAMALTQSLMNEAKARQETDKHIFNMQTAMRDIGPGRESILGMDGSYKLYNNKYNRAAPRSRKFKGDRSKWPIGKCDPERLDLLIMYRLLALNASIPDWLKSQSFVRDQSMWAAQVQNTARTPQQLGSLLLKLVRNVKPNAVARVWFQTVALPIPLRIRPTEEVKPKTTAKSTAKNRRSLAPRGEDERLVAGLPQLTPKGRLVPDTFVDWMYLSGVTRPLRTRGQWRPSRPLEEVVQQLPRSNGTVTEAPPGILDRNASNESIPCRASSVFACKVSRWRGPWHIIGTPLRHMARNPCTAKADGYSYKHTAVVNALNGTPVFLPALPKLECTWNAMLMTASTYAELATLLRMWDGCVRWQDIKQKKASVRGADKALEVLGKKIEDNTVWYHVKRAESEFDDGEWRRDSDVLDLYAIRTYEENEQAAAQIAAQKKAREEAAERLRKLEVNRMLQTQVHMNMQSNLFTPPHVGIMSSASGIGMSGSQRLNISGATLGSLSNSLGRRSPTLLGRGYGGYVLPAPPSNVVPFPNPRPVNPDTERIQKELREKEAQKRVAVLKEREEQKRKEREVRESEREKKKDEKDRAAIEKLLNSIIDRVETAVKKEEIRDQKLREKEQKLAEKAALQQEKALHKIQSRRHAKDGTELFCICRTPYDHTRFYIGCDTCDNWYHTKVCCKKAASSLESYVCDDCKTTKQFCNICRKPYEANVSYIQCKSCSKWFHTLCASTNDDNEINVSSQWACQSCSKSKPSSAAPKTAKKLNTPGRLSGREHTFCKRILKELQQHKNAGPFLQAVSAEEAGPEYFEIILNPMDLQTVGEKLKHDQYSNQSAFVADITLIFDNCKNFNQPGSKIYKMATALEKYFTEQLGKQ